MRRIISVLLLLCLFSVVVSFKTNNGFLKEDVKYKFCGFGTTLPRKCVDIDDELLTVINGLELNRVDITADTVFKKGTMTIDIVGDGERVAQIINGIIKYDGKLYAIDKSLYEMLSHKIKENQ